MSNIASFFEPISPLCKYPLCSPLLLNGCVNSAMQSCDYLNGLSCWQSLWCKKSRKDPPTLTPEDELSLEFEEESSVKQPYKIGWVTWSDLVVNICIYNTPLAPRADWADLVLWASDYIYGKLGHWTYGSWHTNLCLISISRILITLKSVHRTY